VLESYGPYIAAYISALLFTADDMYKRMPKDGKTQLLHLGTGLVVVTLLIFLLVCNFVIVLSDTAIM